MFVKVEHERIQRSETPAIRSRFLRIVHSICDRTTRILAGILFKHEAYTEYIFRSMSHNSPNSSNTHHTNLNNHSNCN